MKQFLAFKGGALIYAQNKTFTGTETAAQPDELAEGAIAVYAKSGTTDKLILVDTAAKFLDVKTFIVARGLVAGCIISDSIERKSLAIDKNAAVAGVAKVITFGGSNSALLGGDATNTIGQIAGFTVVDTSGTIRTDWKSTNYEVVLTSANMNAAQVAVLLVAKINADPKAIVTASTTGATTAGLLILTAKSTGKLFDAHAIDETRTANASKTVTTQPTRAEGSLASLDDLQLECAGYQGATRRGDGILGDLKSYDLIDRTSGSQVIYNVSWTGRTVRTAVATDQVAERFKRLYLAIPTGATAITTLETILAAGAMEEVATQAEESGV